MSKDFDDKEVVFELSLDGGESWEKTQLIEADYLMIDDGYTFDDETVLMEYIGSW